MNWYKIANPFPSHSHEYYSIGHQPKEGNELWFIDDEYNLYSKIILNAVWDVHNVWDIFQEKKRHIISYGRYDASSHAISMIYEKSESILRDRHATKKIKEILDRHYNHPNIEEFN